MPSQAPWSPTAHAFTLHQFSHVSNFWKQGRPASFRLEALPGGQAVLNLTFQLPTASEVIPPPSHVPPVPHPQRPIHPLFPKGYCPQGSSADARTELASQKNVSSKQRKSFRRSVLHRAALAAPSLPPLKNGTLRQAAQACVQRMQAVSASPVDPHSSKKRPLSDSPCALSPSNLLPLAQRIRTDIKIGEAESPEKLRSTPCRDGSPSPISPCAKGFPSPAPLVFTPVQLERSKCVNCDAEMTPDHQCECEELVSSAALAEAEKKFSEFRLRWIKRLEARSDDWALKSKLLESLEDAYLAPVGVISDKDFNDVKDKFFEGVLSPVKFLDELQKLLS